MPTFGFIGPAYESPSLNANAQVCENLYLEKDESGNGKSPAQLLYTPGTKQFAHLYDDIQDVTVKRFFHQGTLTFTIPDGTYYAAMALIDTQGNCQMRSRVFGPFTVKLTAAIPPPHSSPPSQLSFTASIGILPPPGVNWYVYFGTDRTNLNQRLQLTGLSLDVTTPGIAATLPEIDTPNAVQSGIDVDNRCFVASNQGLWELFSDGYAKFLSVIENDLNPKVFAASPLEVLLASAGHVYLYNFANDTVTEILTDGTTQLQKPAVSVGFADGYFIALLNDGRFQISSLFDGSTWDPTDIAKESVYKDTPTAMIVDHRELVIAGPKQSIVYYNSGNPFFPWEVVPGSFAEVGIAAPWSFIKADNTFFWIGQDERGTGMAWQAQGYTPSRISNHAIENHWRKFATVNDAISYSYQEAGHTFVVFYFPSANETWVYDRATQSWHQRVHADEAHRSRCHFLAFGKHLVGDWKTGKIYEMSLDLLTDDGDDIRRVRRAAHIAKEQQWIPHNSLQIDVETGLGPQPPLVDGNNQPRDPQIMLRWSDDGGHTWSNIHTLNCGQAGQFKKRAIIRRLGRSRDRVYEVACSDPVPWRFIEAYLNGDPSG